MAKITEPALVVRMRKQIVSRLESQTLAQFGEELDVTLFNKDFYVWVETHNCFVTAQPLDGFHFSFSITGDLKHQFQRPPKI